MNEIVKDKARQERLNQVYRHLYAHYGIDSQKKMAQAMRVQRTALSAAMNGNKAYLTNNFFTKVCAAFPGVFNLDYLLTGKGSLLDEEIIHDDGLMQITESVDPSSLINAALAAKDETIATLREQNETLKTLISELRHQIDVLKDKSEMSDYTFGFGVADEPIKQIKKL
jgi:transcriptional regulator with XRE-family HTH domain